VRERERERARARARDLFLRVKSIAALDGFVEVTCQLLCLSSRLGRLREEEGGGGEVRVGKRGERGESERRAERDRRGRRRERARARARVRASERER
jgi:hypothetical protein